ncbi:MAG: carbohydrate ABC transporter permease [Candidatus Fimadaptatus sp.]
MAQNTAATAARRKIRNTRSDRIFYISINLILAILGLLILYPLVYIVSCSFSSGSALTAGKVILWPVDISFEGYMAVFSNKNIGVGYKNTLFYTVVGTTVNVIMTMVCAYPLSRRDMPYRGIFMFLFTFTMFFSGGMIPTYMLISQLKLIDNRLVMILPGMIGVYNMILARTFMQSLPYELFEAAEMDGCSDTYYFVRMVLPLSKACMAVIALYYAVGHWNAYFNAFLYLNDRSKYPLSLFLREILVSNQMTESMDLDPELLERKQGLADVLKYSLIIVSTLRVLCVYPFAQKYFVKGVMIGSLKG